MTRFCLSRLRFFSFSAFRRIPFFNVALAKGAFFRFPSFSLPPAFSFCCNPPLVVRSHQCLFLLFHLHCGLFPGFYLPLFLQPSLVPHSLLTSFYRALPHLLHHPFPMSLLLSSTLHLCPDNNNFNSCCLHSSSMSADFELYTCLIIYSLKCRNNLICIYFRKNASSNKHFSRTRFDDLK